MKGRRFSTRETVGKKKLRILVDYSRTLSEMVTSGHYDWFNKDITAKHFSVEGKGKQVLTVELIYFELNVSNVSTDVVLFTLKERKLRPATIAELLAFGEKYPEIQREFPIVGLGSDTRVNGERYAPYLSRRGAGRILNLFWYGGGWGIGHRFLAFRLPNDKAGK